LREDCPSIGLGVVLFGLRRTGCMTFQDLLRESYYDVTGIFVAKRIALPTLLCHGSQKSRILDL
jgi:hypothetical protein